MCEQAIYRGKKKQNKKIYIKRHCSSPVIGGKSESKQYKTQVYTWIGKNKKK